METTFMEKKRQEKIRIEKREAVECLLIAMAFSLGVIIGMLVK